jgi:hypothetical protein
MPDSDDLLIDDSLQPLLEKAINSKADIVVADFLEMNDEEIEENRVIPQTVFHVEEKSGERLFLEDLNPYQCYVWRTLFKRKFLLDNNLQFVPGIRYQDVPFTHECYLKAGKCMRVKWLLNIYRKGHESATYSFDVRKAHDFCISIAETWKLTRRKNSYEIQKKLKNDVYISFTTLIRLVSYSFEDYSVRKKILFYLKELAPDMSFRNGLNQMLTWGLYEYFPHIFLFFNYYGRVFKRRVISYLA